MIKGVHESVFMSSLRAFLVTFFGVCGIAIALALIVFAYYGLYSLVEEDSYSSSVKILTDANGKRKKLDASAPVLLQIDIDGEIGSDKLTAKNIEEWLLESREDIFKERKVKGMLLVVHSPGGGVNDSDIIYRLIKQYKDRYRIPIFAYVNGLCASGGYYIACAADKIYASDVSLIGSIGVLSWPPFMNVVDTMEKIGVNAITLSAGSGKDEMNPFRAWKPDEQKHYQSLIDFYYNRFVEIVSADRKIEKSHLIETLGAKVVPAPEALSLGLVDSCCSSREEVLSALATASGIEGKYQVVGFESKTWWKKILKEENMSPLITGKIKHEMCLPKNGSNPFKYIFIPSFITN